MFSARLKPLFAPVIGRLIGPGAAEFEVLQPEETCTVRPAAYLPGMLQRATATDEHSLLSAHVAAAQQTTVTHAQVLRGTYRNALVRRLGFATWRKSERYSRSLKLGELAKRIENVAELRYCHNYVIWRYFGHWLSEGLPTTLIDPDLGPVWMPPHPTWDHARDYVTTLEIPVLAGELVYADRLVVYQDFGQGSHKQARYATVRDKLQARFGNGEATDCVFIRRGQTGSPRWIANEAALIDDLIARNWQIADVAKDSIESLQRKLCRARVVVSMDGSHINHAQVSLLPGSAIVILLPHDRFTSHHIGIARAHQLSPGLMILNGNPRDGYTVDPDELFRTIDLAESAASQPG